MAESVIENTPRDQNVVGSITTADGFTVESNHETAEQLGANISDPAAGETQPPAKAEPTRRRRSNRHDDPFIAVSEAKGRTKEAERLAAEATERATKLEAEIAELKKPKPAPAAAPVAAAPAAPPVAAAAPPPAAGTADWKRYAAMPDAPKMANFTGDNAFEEWQWAINTFVSDKRFDERMAHVQQMNAAQQVHAQFTQRLMDAKTRIPDFDARFNPQTPIDTRVFTYIQRLDNAPDVMLYLSEHQDIAQRLTTLHPVDQIGQIGEIAGTLKTQNAAALSSASARPASSQAKPVAKRVTGVPPAAADEPPGDDASEEAHEAYWGPRRQQIRQHRRHR